MVKIGPVGTDDDVTLQICSDYDTTQVCKNKRPCKAKKGRLTPFEYFVEIFEILGSKNSIFGV